MKIILKHVKRQKILFMIMQIIIKIVFLSSSIKTYKFDNKPCVWKQEGLVIADGNAKWFNTYAEEYGKT